MNDMSAGLLKFCLEHSDYREGSGQGIPERDPNDYKWLKEALDNLQTDTQRMKKILETIKTDQLLGETALSSALEELQYYVEDIDNGNDFWKIGGAEVMLKLLEKPGTQIKMWIMWIFATVVQNNPESQEKAIKAGILERMMDVAKSSLYTSEVDTLVLSKSVSGISALVKGSDTALDKFISLDGLDLVFQAIKNDKVNTQTRVKLLFLLKHLIQFKPADTKPLLRNPESLDRVINLVKSQDPSHLDLREKALMVLNEFLQGDKEALASDIELCKKQGLDKVVANRILEIKNLALENEVVLRHSDEVALCGELYSRLGSNKPRNEMK